MVYQMKMNTNEAIIWNALTKIRTNYLLTYSLASKCLHDSFLPAHQIKLNVEQFGEHFEIVSKEAKIEQIQKSYFQTTANMFVYLNSCPKSIYPWIMLFNDLFENKSPPAIILTLNRILKIGSQKKQLMIITEKIFRKVSLALSLKHDEINSLTDPNSSLNRTEENILPSESSAMSQMGTLTNHPVHIINKNGDLSTSAFIPFCEFGGEMSTMGKKIDAFSEPVCASFEPRNLNDQLCYVVDLEKFKDPNNIESQLKLGFAFILDYNEDRQVVTNAMSNESQGKSGLIGKLVETFDSHASIFLNTVGMSI